MAPGRWSRLRGRVRPAAPHRRRRCWAAASPPSCPERSPPGPCGQPPHGGLGDAPTPRRRAGLPASC